MTEIPSRSATPARRATLKDVAIASGVSQSTTSRAISGEGYVAAAVRERVLAAASDLGYVPHAMARSLRKQVSRSIGVLVSDLRNTFYADLAAGVAARAREHGYTMMLVDDQGLVDEEYGAAEAFVATRAAGVIVTPVSSASTDYLVRQNTPVVEVDRQFATDTCDGVIVDNSGVARRMTDHLIGLGHRRIALLIDETEWTVGAERAVGYRQSLEQSGLGLEPEQVVPTGWDVESARDAAIGVLTHGDRPTALFAANNLLAQGLWRAVHDLGLRVPDDVSIVSFDDAQWMSMVTPGVTAIAQDAVALGRAAVDLLLDRIREPDAPPKTVVLEAEIRARGSTAAPGGDRR